MFDSLLVVYLENGFGMNNDHNLFLVARQRDICYLGPLGFHFGTDLLHRQLLGFEAFNLRIEYSDGVVPLL